MHTRLSFIASLAGLVAAGAVGAQPRRALPAPKYTKVVEVDSMNIWGPALSPDGRWVAFSGAYEYAKKARNLWIVSATGGKPRQLTMGDYVDAVPVWFPKSDRIVFRSTRVGSALMTIGINPATGQATDTPRRLTLEESGDHYDVSPDGRWVAFNVGPAPSAEHGGVLGMIPSSGGARRTIDSVPPGHGGFISPWFTKDNRFVEYIHVDENRVEAIRRVPVGGGPPVTIVNPSPRQLRYGAGVVADVHRDRDSVWLENLSGDTIGMIVLHGLATAAPYRTLRFTSQPNTMLGATWAAGTEVHIVSTDGGTPRRLRAGAGDDYAEGFLTDGRVLVSHPGNRVAIDIVPMNGGTAKRVMLPDSARFDVMSSDGKLVYWQKGVTNSWKKRATFAVLDVDAGTSQTISQSYIHSGGEVWSPVGSRADQLYVDLANDHVELRAWSPVARTSRLVRSIPGAGDVVRDYTMHGDVVAYSTVGRDSVVFFVASNGSSPAQRVWAARGNHTDGISISRDGRHMAFASQMINGSDTAHAIGFADLRPDGTLAGAARILPVSYVAGPPTWLPNNTEIVYLGMNGKMPAMMRLGAQPGARPRILTSNEHLAFWDFAVSPDGKWISYPADLRASSTIWRIDFPRLDPR